MLIKDIPNCIDITNVSLIIFTLLCFSFSFYYKKESKNSDQSLGIIKVFFDLVLKYKLNTFLLVLLVWSLWYPDITNKLSIPFFQDNQVHKFSENKKGILILPFFGDQENFHRNLLAHLQIKYQNSQDYEFAIGTKSIKESHDSISRKKTNKLLKDYNAKAVVWGECFSNDKLKINITSKNFDSTTRKSVIVFPKDDIEKAAELVGEGIRNLIEPPFKNKNSKKFKINDLLKVNLDIDDSDHILVPNPLSIDVDMISGGGGYELNYVPGSGYKISVDSLKDITMLNSNYKKIYSLIIGISEFEDVAMPRLAYASKDAKDLYLFLTENYKNVTADLLINDDAKRGNIIDKIDNIKNSISKDDLVFIYFSGHGIMDISGGKENRVMATFDLDLKDASGTGIVLDELESKFSGDGFNNVVMVIDSCYSSVSPGNPIPLPMYSDGSSEGRNVLGGGAFLTGNPSVPRFVVISSTRNNGFALEGTKWGNGLFTSYLLSGLKGKADLDSDDNISMYEFYTYLEENVKRESKGLQVPSIRFF